jgi:hypothetical protein
MSQPYFDADLDQPEQVLDCFRSFQFITESPKWMMNVLCVSICQMIPLIGPLAVLGYQFELAESLLRRPDDRGYLDFDFNKFVDYMKRGLWPFLTALIAGIVIGIPIMVIVLGLIFGGAMIAQANRDAGDVIGIALIGVMVVLYFVLLIGANMLVIPLMIRAGYCQDLGQALDFHFVKSFVQLMWKEIIITNLFLMVATIPLMLIGLLMCLVGIYLTIGVMMLAQAHLIDYQLYAIYLSRGGEPIPLKRVV